MVLWLGESEQSPVQGHTLSPNYLSKETDNLPQYVASTKFYLHLKPHVSQSPTKDPSWWQSRILGRHHDPCSVSWATICFSALKLFLLEGSNLGILWAFLVQLQVLGSTKQKAIWGEGTWMLFVSMFSPSPQPKLHTGWWPSASVSIQAVISHLGNRYLSLRMASKGSGQQGSSRSTS